jgi:hypothetical protein
VRQSHHCRCRTGCPHHHLEPPIGLEPRYAPLLRSPTVYETVAGGFAREQSLIARPEVLAREMDEE